MFTSLLGAAIPLCRTPEERLFLQQVILDRVVVFRPARNYLYRPNNEPYSGGKLIAECLERLRFEGNEHLLRLEELPEVLLLASFRLHELPSLWAKLPERLADSERERLRLETELLRLERERVQLETMLIGLRRSRMLKLGRLIRRMVGTPTLDF